MCCLSLIGATEKLKQQSSNFPGGGAFEQLFSMVRREFEQKFSKNSNAQGVVRGGMLKLRFDWYITMFFMCVLQDKSQLRACSHGGGGPQVGEVPHLPVVKESQPSHAIFTTLGRWGEVSKCFQIFSTRS